MEEPTEEQLKILREDIISGRVMIVEVEHYKLHTDNLDKSYNANKQLTTKLEAKDERIAELEAENNTSKEYLKHIKNVLSSAIDRPDEIAIDWKDFLLKLIERVLKAKTGG